MYYVTLSITHWKMFNKRTREQSSLTKVGFCPVSVVSLGGFTIAPHYQDILKMYKI
jgi:hypothetical protein